MKKINITNERYGRLTVLKEVKSDTRHRRWLCICDCGNKIIANMYSLRNGNTKSCGCLRKDNLQKSIIKDLKGKKFGRLTVIEKTNKRDSSRSIIWYCKCDCGNETEIAGRNLTSGETNSCGCLIQESGKKLKAYNQKHHFKDGVYVPGLTSKLRTDNTTGVKGVYAVKKKSGIKYQAKIFIKKRAIHIGTFDTIEQATKARKQAEIRYHHPYLYDD